MATTSRRICKAVALLLLLPLFSAVRTTPDTPYALIFGLSSITVSRFTSSKGYEESIFPAGNEYTTYFEHLLLNHGNKFKRRGSWYRHGEDKEQASPHTYDRNATTALFLNAVENVTEILRSELGHEPTYAVVVLPPIFDTGSNDAPIPSVFPYGVLPQGKPGEVDGIDDTACFAYRVDLCQNQGWTAAECQDKKLSTTLHLIVNYEKNYLYLALDSTYFEYITFPPVFGELSQEFGEESGRSARETDEATYTNRLKDHFIEFINKALNSNYLGYKWDMIRTVVFVGEASRDAFAPLRKIVYDVMGANGRVPIYDTIDPAKVVAQGAAKYAQLTVLRPELWNYQYHDEDADFGRDEL